LYIKVPGRAEAQFILQTLGHPYKAKLPRYDAGHRGTYAQHVSYFYVAHALFTPGEPLRSSNYPVFNGDFIWNAHFFILQKADST